MYGMRRSNTRRRTCRTSTPRSVATWAMSIKRGRFESKPFGVVDESFGFILRGSSCRLMSALT